MISCRQSFENTYTTTARTQSYPVGQPTSPSRAAHLRPSPSHFHISPPPIIGDKGRNGGSTGGRSPAFGPSTSPSLLAACRPSTFGPCTSPSLPAIVAARQVAQRVASWSMWLCDRKSFQFMASSRSRAASRSGGRVELGCAVRFAARLECVSGPGLGLGLVWRRYWWYISLLSCISRAGGDGALGGVVLGGGGGGIC